MSKRGLDHAEPYDSPLYGGQVHLSYDVLGNLEYAGKGTPKAKSSESL